MSKKIEVHKPTDPLDETVLGELVPLAFSTEIKSKKNQRISKEMVDRDYSFIYSDFKNDDKVKSTTKNVLNDENKSDYDISSRYLVKHERPMFISASFSREISEEKMPLRETNIDQPDSKDMSHFRRFSNSINDSSFFAQDHNLVINIPIIAKDTNPFFENDLEQLKSNETYNVLQEDNDDNDEHSATDSIMNKAKQLNLNDTTVVGFDELLNDVTLYDSFNMTKLASNLKRSETQVVEQGQKELCVESTDSVGNVVLLSDKSYILWVGIPVQEGGIKSFKLNLKSMMPQQVEIRIKGKSGCFFLTNHLGQNRTQTVTVTFEPKTDKKFYVAFHPINSNYHNDVVIITVADRRFKINLFGYAEPATCELKGFHNVDHPRQPGKVALMKTYSRVTGQNRFTMTAFNSGARTAFVALYSHCGKIRFQPRMFLLIPKTKMEFDVTIKMSVDVKLVDFFIITVDEELRRAARINFSELPAENIYQIFNHIQIFSRLPEEKTIRQDDLPKYDWRPYLCRQINSSFHSCYLNLSYDDGPSSAADRWTNDSVSTIGMLSKSSLTGRSALSNVEHLYSKSLYLNNTESHLNTLNQSLSAVLILKPVNTFTPTVVAQSNYLGVLITNNNPWRVDWRVSDMIGCHQDSLWTNGSKDRVSVISEDNASSVYSLTSIPVYNTASTMTVLHTQGSLAANETVVVPIRFTPANTGRTECHCHIRVVATDDEDLVFERDVHFVGQALRLDQERVITPPIIPGLTIEPSMDSIVRLSDLKDGRVTLNMTMKNRLRHGMEIFVSRLQPPFELKTGRIYLTEKTNILCIVLRPVDRGTYRDLLVLMDHDGNCAYTHLTVYVK